jgi:hypothetical protein
MKLFKKKKKESEFFLAIKALIDDANKQSLKVVHVKPLNSK